MTAPAPGGITYHRHQELPPYAIHWLDHASRTIDLTAYSATAQLLDHNDLVVLTKSTGIDTTAASPNLVVNWAPGDLDLPPGRYRVMITARAPGALDRVFSPGRLPGLTIVEPTAPPDN